MKQATLVRQLIDFSAGWLLPTLLPTFPVGKIVVDAPIAAFLTARK
jgi:hypothetical protein